MQLVPKAIRNYWLRRNGLRNLHVPYCLGFPRNKMYQDNLRERPGGLETRTIIKERAIKPKGIPSRHVETLVVAIPEFEIPPVMFLILFLYRISIISFIHK